VHQHVEPVGHDRRGPAREAAVERGLTRKPWVKTTLAPGSRVVMDYYHRAGLTPYLEARFQPRRLRLHDLHRELRADHPEVSAAVHEHDLSVVSVLSGNRNFEGRINPDVRMNYLASPPLVVAYALAGTMDLDLVEDPLGDDAEGNPVLPA
jgi:aconitate hydratase